MKFLTRRHEGTKEEKASPRPAFLRGFVPSCETFFSFFTKSHLMAKKTAGSFCFFVVPIFCFLCGCVHVSERVSPYSFGGRFTDQSPSPISEKKALQIALDAVKKRTPFLETQGICARAERIDAGGWRAIVHRTLPRKNHTCCVLYDSTPPFIVLINKEGKVTSYVQKRVKGE
jgi:hypothetical protein